MTEIIEELEALYWPYFKSVEAFDTTYGGITNFSVEWIEQDVDPDEGPSDPDGDYSLWVHPIYAICKVNVNGVERYFKRTGTVQSHAGEEWGPVEEVTPREETITTWSKVAVRNDLTTNEIEKAFKGDDDFWWSEMSYRHHPEKPVVIGGVSYPVEIIDSQDGYEGVYSLDTYIIFKVGSQVFKKTGHYASHVGTEWDGPLREVKSVEKTVTVWEEK